MRYLLFSFLLLSGCASEYKTLRTIPLNKECIDKIKPKNIATSWYKASIDVVGKHISGLLLIKNMPDSSSRIVFTNEAGVKFLDFEFLKDRSFKVHQVIKQLNRKPVIRLLKKDFELIQGIPFQTSSLISWENRDEIYYGVRQKNGIDYFITSQDCASLHRVESASKRKRKVSLFFMGKNQQQPDSINLQHHTFAMRIALRKIVRE